MATFRLLTLITLAVALPASARGAGGADAGVAPAGILRVGLVGAPPFVTGDAPPDGFAVQVWAAAAERLNVEWDPQPADTPEGGLAALARGELDVVVGPVSITAERSTLVRFTQPWFHGSLAIAAPPRGPSAFERLKPFFARAFLVAVGGLLVILCVVGTLVWLFERKKNSAHFPAHPVPGIAAGLWFALVTMTTVGYGDKAPTSLGGKLVSGVWMLIAMLTASSLTAGIATGLTLSQLERPALSSAAELAGRSVAVPRGSLAETFAAQNGARTRPVASLDEAFRLLEAGTAVAVVDDRAILSDYLQKHPGTEIALSQTEYQRRGYGFAVQVGDPLLAPLDVALLQLTEEGRVEELRQRWLGP